MPRVLIVDDCAEFGEAVSTRLRRAGHEVACLKDGREAVLAHQAEPFDLVLLDYRMPQLDGVETMLLFRRMLHRTVRWPRVIAYTCTERRYSMHFEPIMASLGAKPVRCEETADPLVELAEKELMPGTAAE